MMPNVRYVYISIYILEILLILSCNDHCLSVKKMDGRLAYLGEIAEKVREETYFIVVFPSSLSS